MPNKHETKKLFYNKYLYKISVNNPLAYSIRHRHFAYVRSQLSMLQESYDKKEPLIIQSFRRHKRITEFHFLQARSILDILDRNPDCKVRVEGLNISFYTNDETLLIAVKRAIGNNDYEIWQPSTECVSALLSDENIIIVDKPPEYKLKVTLKDQDASAFADWISNNRDKVKAGDTFIRNAKISKWLMSGMYVYARDEKILQLITLMGVKIRRVDKLVCKQDLDK